MMSISSLFFSCSSDHRDLHSFPTRRSSDLRWNELAGFVLRSGNPHRVCTGREYRHRADRSEEHTSELQSLTNLVCRLLLEKKNTISVGLPASSPAPTTTGRHHQDAGAAQPV